MIIKLNESQLNYAKNLAKKRHFSKPKDYQTKKIIMNIEDSDFSAPHTIGIMGEVAYSLHTGENLDENIYEYGDCGNDFKDVEVKTITFFGNGEPELKIPKKEYEFKKPKVYVLARVSKFDLSKVELLGKITREDFDKIKVSKRYGYSDRNPENWIAPLSKMEKL